MPKMIRVPDALHARIAALAAQYMQAYTTGRTTAIEPQETGFAEPTITMAQVIERAITELEQHRARSRKKTP